MKNLGLHNLIGVFTGRNRHSATEKVHHWLFIVGISVEMVLLVTVFINKNTLDFLPNTDLDVSIQTVLIIVLLPVLFFHQFVIFRNTHLVGQPGEGKGVLGISIAVFFGILTGEIGYLYVILKSNGIEFLNFTDAIIGPDKPSDQWTLVDLGKALKAMFSLGAFILFILILVWDLRAYFNESSKNFYGNKLPFFFIPMDILAIIIWGSIFGVMVPDGRLFIPKGLFMFLILITVSLYATLGLIRIVVAISDLNKVKPENVARTPI